MNSDATAAQVVNECVVAVPDNGNLTGHTLHDVLRESHTSDTCITLMNSRCQEVGYFLWHTCLDGRAGVQMVTVSGCKG